MLQDALRKTARRLDTLEEGRATEGTRIGLTSALTLYVRFDGNDSNNGQTNDAAGAFSTIQAAVNFVRANYESDVYGITIQLQAGTWNVPATIVLGPHSIYGGVNIRGDAATPSNVIVNATTQGQWLFLPEYPGRGPWKLQGMRIQRGGAATDVNLVLARFGVIVELHNMEFGNAGSGAHIYAVEYALVAIRTSYAILGGGGYHLLANRFAMIEDVGAAINGTITNTPNFTGAFALADHGFINLPNVTYSAGALTVGVKQYEANNLGEVKGTFPGSVAGTTANNGIKT